MKIQAHTTYKVSHKNLLNDLSNFGLNPQDWKLSRKSKIIYKISHRSIDNFHFCGYSRNSQKWQHLELSSL